MRILINPKTPNQQNHRGIEPPIWCTLLAKPEDRIVDMEVDPIFAASPASEILIVVMGHNPSVSSTPKMPEALRLKALFQSQGHRVMLTGLHPQSTGMADYQIPSPQELIEIKRARWELLDMTRYRAHDWHCLGGKDRSGYAAVYTSYGCPFSCYFCNVHSLYRSRKVYYREPRDVIAEIEYLVENCNVKNLKISDELFTLNPTHVSSICSGIKDYNLNIWAYGRVDTVTPELSKAMKAAGVNWVSYGFESKGIADKTVEQAINMTRDAGINIMGNFMFGLPGDDTKRTMEFALEHLFEYVNFYVALPYPGSQWYEDTHPDRSEESFDQYSPAITQFRNKLYKDYFLNPDYLHMLDNKFGCMAVKEVLETLQERTGIIK